MRTHLALLIAVVGLSSVMSAPAPRSKLDLSKEGIARLLKKFPKDELAIEEFFRLVLERKPANREMTAAMAHSRKPNMTRQNAFEDIVWALTNSTEYLAKQRAKGGK